LPGRPPTLRRLIPKTSRVFAHAHELFVEFADTLSF
jgi:hypothetical protein